MADYSLASQVQQFQAPNLLALAAQGQQMQSNAMKTQLMQQEAARDAELRQAFARPDFDPTSPQGIRTAGMLGGLDAALKAGTAARQNESLQRQTQVSIAEMALKNRELISRHGQEFRDNLRMVDAQPEDQRPAAYGRLIALLPPDLQAVFPRQYSPDAVRRGMSTTTQLLDAAKPQYQMFDGVPVAVTPETGTFTPLREAGAGAPMGGAGAPAVGGTPAARAAAPVAGGEAGYLTGLDRAEGSTKNPYSSADGKFQFINSTFVDTARKAFPVLADKSPAEILTLRGFKLANGKQIEDVLEQRLRADNTQALTSAGIAPTPGNTYLAHFLGAGGARSLLSVDPNTPVSQILDPRAIAANKSVLEGKTAGQVAAWADSKFGGSPGLAASMTAGNQRQAGVGAPSFTPAMGGGMSPTAPTVNNAMVLDLMGQQPPQQGNALAMQPASMMIAPPQAAPALSPYQQARQDARQRELDVYKQKEEIKRSASQELTPVQEQKMRTDIGEARANAGESMATLQETVRAAKDVLALPEETKNAISGYTGRYTPNLSASAKDAQTKFNDIVGQITAMAKASAGSIGSMAVQEWKILADQVASLDLTNMDAKTLDRQMKIIVNRAEGLMNRTRSNYTNIYGPLMEKYKGQFDLPAPTPSIAIGIDPRAIEKLRNDPSMAKAFDEHFGRPGAAAAILGK
jgi:hypothetical protein